MRRRLGAHAPGTPCNRLALPGDTACRNTQPNGNLNTQSTQTDIGGIYSMLSILCSQAFIIEAPQRQHSGRKQIPRYWSEAGLPLSAVVFEDMGGCGFEPAADFDLLRLLHCARRALHVFLWVFDWKEQVGISYMEKPFHFHSWTQIRDFTKL